MRIFVLLLVLVSLEGCAEYRAQQQANANAQYQAQLASDDAQCRSYGVQPGSPPYVQCRMNLNNLRAQDDQQRRALATQYLIAHPFGSH
jgi:hypothetical protein